MSLVAIVAILALSCSTGGGTDKPADTYTISTLPSKIMMDVPASLVSTAAKGVTAKGAGPTDGSYVFVKSMVSMMQDCAASVSMMFVLGDFAISQNNLQLDSGDHPDLTITLTEELYNAMLDAAPAGTEGPDRSAIGETAKLGVNYKATIGAYDQGGFINSHDTTLTFPDMFHSFLADGTFIDPSGTDAYQAKYNESATTAALNSLVADSGI